MLEKDQKYRDRATKTMLDTTRTSKILISQYVMMIIA